MAWTGTEMVIRIPYEASVHYDMCFLQLFVLVYTLQTFTVGLQHMLVRWYACSDALRRGKMSIPSGILPHV